MSASAMRDEAGAVTLPDGEGSPVLLLPIAGGPEPLPRGRLFVDEETNVPADRRQDAIVLVSAGGGVEALARLEAGFAGIMLGDAALRDPDIVTRLAGAFGPERVGVVATCARAEVGWAMDAESNADFRFMRPTRCEPDWEIFTSAGARTGALARWWLREMFARGAGAAMVRMDILDDADLNIAAGLAEDHGDRLWFAPRGGPIAAVDEWHRYGHVRQLAWPQARIDGDRYLRAWRDAGAASDRRAMERTG